MHSPPCEVDIAISLFDRVEVRPGEVKSDWALGLQRTWDVAMAHFLQEGTKGSRA